MTTSRVTATAPSNASAPDEPTVVIERQAAPSARPTLSRRERFHLGPLPFVYIRNDSSGYFFEMTEAEGLDHPCLDRRDVLVGLVGTKRCANDGAPSAATPGLTHEVGDGLRDVMRIRRVLALEHRAEGLEHGVGDLADLAVGLLEKAGNPFATALHRESCGGPRYGNSSSRSLCGPTLSPVTFPFVSMEKKTSTTSSVSVRPLCGKRAGPRGS